MKHFHFLIFLLLTFSLYAQVSFQYETRNFTQLGLTTNEQIANYLQIELSDLLPIFLHNSMRGHVESTSPADMYNMISSVLRNREFATFQKISRELGVTMERFFLVFAREMGDLPEADLQMTLACIRIGVKWDIISP